MPFVPNVPGVPSLASYLTTPLPLLAVDTAISLSQGLNSLQWGIYDQFGIPVIASALSPLFNLGPILSALNAASSALLGQQLINQFSVVDFEYKQDWNITTAPVEAGGFQSYNKVQLPFDIRMRVAAGGSIDNRQSLLTVVDNLANAGLTAGLAGSIQAALGPLSPFAVGTTGLSTTLSSLVSGAGLLSGIATSILGIPTSIPLYNVLTPEKIFTNCSVSHYDYKRTNVNGVGILVIDIWLQEVRVTATSSFANTQSPVAAGQQSLGNQQPSASIPLGSVAPQ